MIRNLVFDVGGVLLEYRWQDMFRQQGLSEEEIGKLEQVLFRDEIWAVFRKIHTCLLYTSPSPRDRG